MNRTDLANRIAAEHNLTKTRAEQIVTDVFQTIAAEVQLGTEVSIAKFGKFKAANRAARIARNPQTGESIKVAAKRALKFSPASNLKTLD